MTALSLSLVLGQGCSAQDWPLSRPRLKRLVLASLPADCDTATIAIVVVGRAEGRRLNREFRQKDYATNILTFPYAGAPDVRADLVICVPVAKSEARAQRRPLDHHLAHLVVHGTLHACGMDHQDNAEAEQMEALETAVLRRFRIADPYCEHSR